MAETADVQLHHHQAAIIALCRVVNRYVGNLPPMPGRLSELPCPVIRNSEPGTGDDELGHAAAAAHWRAARNQHPHLILPAEGS